MRYPDAEQDEAYTAYVTARSLWLRRVAYLLCQDWQRAADLVQTTVTQLYVHWRRVSTVENLDGYARTVLVRAFLAEQRSGWMRRVVVSGEVPEVAAPQAAGETAVDVRAALAGLPPRQRAVIVLRFYCDMSVERTAEALRCSTGTVKSQTSRALATLRERLEREEYVDGH